MLRELRARQEKLNKKAGVAGAAAVPGGPVATVTVRELLARFQTHMSEAVLKQRLRERCFCEPHGAGDSTWALRPDAKVCGFLGGCVGGVSGCFVGCLGPGPGCSCGCLGGGSGCLGWAFS